MSDIPETDMPFQKRLCLTALASRFKVEESSTTAAAMQTWHTLAHRVDYRFIDTLDTSIRSSKRRVMIAVEVVNKRVTDLATTQRHETHELYVHHKDAQDNHDALRAQISLLTRERERERERERGDTFAPWLPLMSERLFMLDSHGLTQYNRMEWQRQQAGDMVTSAFGRIYAFEARDPTHHNDVEDTSSSY
ncbi:hypothetical protein Tco_1170913 [Tanacetum coccineum]